jgi:hypothetical protein
LRDAKTFQYPTLSIAITDLAKWSDRALRDVSSVKRDDQSLDVRRIKFSIVRNKRKAALAPETLPTVRRPGNTPVSWNGKQLDGTMKAIASFLDLQGIDQRREKRAPTVMCGKLTYGGAHKTVINCLIVDLSEGGARVETIVAADVPEAFILRAGDAPGRRAYRRWASGHQIGLEFVIEAA